MNESNLKPFQKGEARARDAGRKGGVASGEVRRERFKELLLAELDSEEVDSFHGPRGMSRRRWLVRRLVNKAAFGDLKAIQMVLKLTGEDGEERGQSVSEA